MTKHPSVKEIIERVYLYGMNGGLGYGKFENEMSPKDATQSLKALVTEMVEKALEPNEWHDTEGEYGLKCNGKGECHCYASYVNHYTLPKRLERAKAEIERRFE